MKDKVIEALKREYDALDILSINNLLNFTSTEELSELSLVMKELVDDLIVYQTKKNKYIIYENCPNFRKGKIQVKENGFGFLLLENEKDIHISKEYLNYALDGDIVLVEILGSNAEKPDGKVIKVLKRDSKNIVGTIISDKGNLVFEPNSKKGYKIKLKNEELKSCVEGEIVVVSLIEDLGKNYYRGRITEHIGHKDDPNMDIKIIAAEHEIYFDFPEDAIKEANKLPVEVLDNDYIGRTNLEDQMIFTIDGEDTKDIDDAISLEKKDGVYILGVHIADVSYYVKENSALDKEAYKRGTSSYLASSVIPMFPHKLSNGICSLNPNVSRCALSTFMTIDQKGNTIDVSFFPSIIKSKKKMTYKSVNHLLVDGIVDSGYEEFKDKLILMKELADILRHKRIKDGYIDFEIPEPKIVTDENGKAIDVIKRDRGPGEMLIEDFMIANNEAISTFISNMDLPFIYRIHDVPNQEKLDRFLSVCNILGNQIKGKYIGIRPRDFQHILEQVDDESGVLRNLALRSMAKAKYSMNNIGHFGLGLKYYSHWTSPIRRYPDLLAHRLVRTFIFEKNIDIKTINYWESNIEDMAIYLSKRELNAVDAERDVDKMKMAEYMEGHVGEVYDAYISGIVKSGIFVQLENLVEGKINVNSLGNEQFNFIEEFQSLKGMSTGKRYILGEKLKVRCVRASKALSQIDFEIETGDINGNK